MENNQFQPNVKEPRSLNPTSVVMIWIEVRLSQHDSLFGLTRTGRGMITHTEATVNQGKIDPSKLLSQQELPCHHAGV